MPTVIKSSVLFGLILGIVMGVVWWLVSGSFKEALMWALVMGGVVGAVMFFTQRRVHNAFAGKYVGATGETLLREGPANLWERSLNASTDHAGYLYLTNQHLHFKPLASSDKAREVKLGLTDIIEVAAFTPTAALLSTGLRLRTLRGETSLNIPLGGNTDWVDAITQAKKT